MQHRVPVQVGIDHGMPLGRVGSGRELGDGFADQGLAGGTAVGELLLAGGAGVQADPVVARRVRATDLLRQALDEQPLQLPARYGSRAMAPEVNH
ncbi:hypothetical protein [Kitasatospora sp. NPDC001527]|uniref:hypothetical protein n=1 Tax=Kitasatospora sp. NPDC001527 TaxID=3154519 RepID=UPI003317DD4E